MQKTYLAITISSVYVHESQGILLELHYVPARCCSIALHNNTKQSEGEIKLLVFSRQTS